MAESRNPARCASCGATLPDDAPGGICPRCLLQQGMAPPVGDTLSADLGQDPNASGRANRFEAPAPSELARALPQLEILELIGQGGMGAVYKARQPNLGRTVAVKILPPAVGESIAFAERFTREAQALARLNHPSIVAVYDFGRTELGSGVYYFVMEYVDGSNLRQLVRSGDLKPEQALAIVPQICDALQYAHDEGIVHRDVKPENILVDRKGRVKIADFGLAKLLDPPGGVDTLTREGESMGTPLYMAPEQMQTAHKVDHRADIYSLGVVFYEMLTGDLPMGRFSPPSRRVNVDVRLDEVVLRALEREPEQRYQHARDVKTEVETISAETEPRAGPEAAGPARSSEVLAQVAAPARGLVVTGVINWILLVGVLVALGFPRARVILSDLPVPRSLAGIIAVVAFFGSGAMILAGVKMMRLEARGLAMIAGFLAMVVTPGNLLGLPIGVWVWAVLHRPDVRAAFAIAENDGPWPDRVRGFLRSTQNCSVLLCGLGVFTIVAPWIRVSFLWHMWGFGWNNLHGIAVASISAGLFGVLFVTSTAKPRPVTRSLLVLAGGVAIVLIAGMFVQAVIVESSAAEAAYDPDWPSESSDDAGGDSVTDVNRTLNEQMNTIATKSMALQVGPFLAIAAGLGLVVTSLIELAGRLRHRPAPPDASASKEVTP